MARDGMIVLFLALPLRWRATQSEQRLIALGQAGCTGTIMIVILNCQGTTDRNGTTLVY